MGVYHTKLTHGGDYRTPDVIAQARRNARLRGDGRTHGLHDTFKGRERWKQAPDPTSFRMANADTTGNMRAYNPNGLGNPNSYVSSPGEAKAVARMMKYAATRKHRPAFWDKQYYVHGLGTRKMGNLMMGQGQLEDYNSGHKIILGLMDDDRREKAKWRELGGTDNAYGTTRGFYDWFRQHQQAQRDASARAAAVLFGAGGLDEGGDVAGDGVFKGVPYHRDAVNTAQGSVGPDWLGSYEAFTPYVTERNEEMARVMAEHPEWVSALFDKQRSNLDELGLLWGQTPTAEGRSLLGVA